MFQIIQSTEINQRIEFPYLCAARDMNIALEVGTERGIFAKQFMERYHGDLICIDSYRPYEEIPGTRLPDMVQALLALHPWHGRVRMIQDVSPGVVDKLPNWIRNHVRFVYIDASHLYENVLADIRAWWDFLPSASNVMSMLAGHDFNTEHQGVIDAVTDFAEENDLTVRIVTGDSEPSWYIYRHEPSYLIEPTWREKER